MAYKDFERMAKSIQKMLEETPEILNFHHNEIPRDHQGFYLDIDDEGNYIRPGEGKHPHRRYDFGESES